MRKALLLAFALVLVAGTAGAQSFIRYTAPGIGAGGSFTAPILGPAANNCAAIPYSFTGDTNTGLCTSAADTWDLYTAGSSRLSGNSTAVTSTVPFYAPVGSAAAPAYSFATGTNFGIFVNTGSSYLGFSIANTLVAVVDNAAATTSGLRPGSDDTNHLGRPDVKWANMFLNRSIQGSKSKALTDAAAATAYATIAVPTNAQIAGELIWTATSSASTVRFVANGKVRWWGADEGGTPVCGINKIGTDGEGHSSGANTLVCTWTNVVATTNCVLSVTCTNDTAGTDPITINGRFDMPTTATITFN